MDVTLDGTSHEFDAGLAPRFQPGTGAGIDLSRVSNGQTRAAQYVRMSTEHQRYSTDNQVAAIGQYAKRRGIAVVRTYADEGKSGLRLNGREALTSLIKDVLSGTADYSTILVYDISRWGRFQDTDESAHYEFICRRAGISVHYCAEQFENDGSPVSAIIKGIKRAMAGEYSRELSVKTFVGQSRLVGLGFHIGSHPGFGLRRMLIDQNGVPKGELAPGERKSISTDRVVLVPGPASEVATIQWVYRAFVDEGRPEREILRLLQYQRVATHDGKPWNYKRVHQLLTNPKYAGDNVWNRVSGKLGKKQTRNDPKLWIRRDGAFPAIVDLQLFKAAQAIIRKRSQRRSDQDMLTRLASLQQRLGHLSGRIIEQAGDLPKPATYARRFGSLLAAYRLIGVVPGQGYRPAEVQGALRQLRPKVLDEVVGRIVEAGGRAEWDPRKNLLTVNDELTVAVVIASCCRRARRRTPCWDISFGQGQAPDLAVIVRLDRSNLEALDYYILPGREIKGRTLRLTHANGVQIDAYRFESLEPLYQRAARMHVLNVK